ncbi:MAG: DUF11 domain-containing protein [Pseudomonadales bacterium]|nr:DUF11 domain-containing protein [Pseudomonadales bacterium]NIX08440.1 DUF11 domain-containing protein [Pseudomonadales bacterium]
MRMLARNNVWLVPIAAVLLAWTANVPEAAARVTLSNTVAKFETVQGPAGQAERRLVAADEVFPGDELVYTITFANEGREEVAAGSIVITNPIPEVAEYLDGSAAGEDTTITFSVDGETFDRPAALTVQRGDSRVVAEAIDYQAIRWAYDQALEPGEFGTVSFAVRLR